MPSRMRALSGFSSRTRKRRSLLRRRRKPRIDSNTSSTDSSADIAVSGSGNAEAALTSLFAATSLTRVSSRNFDIVKKMTQKNSIPDSFSETTPATSAGSLGTIDIISTSKTTTTTSKAATAEKLSDLAPPAQIEYEALREQCPSLPADPSLHAGILLLVTDCAGEVKLGKCDGEPGCETPSKLGSLKRRANTNFGD
ncbi:hypothetical protein H112_05017 [Trichophyton rubrum D6]|uniref:Uncharacterized protein n=4 Tax=Trichophyton TaxID=5550 RepID=F2SKR4_TRIRC|nr:uncharacterized protein TERG_02782 [Trichophyton rubrum CBS 118892]EZF22027.1 hypothetical protein H100_05040 [Trichophyton rubrum MR850]EZF41014.1 hypothetical protein H102_05026 [Trichophyton rubrum CBS 100081]EZF51520.1 hypothetical protein H103_05028 [Trichophyton rubrum CBS 288.86]EZF62265.1 hypothetical protein H104_05021 [Trichophyton rubrum CBS 289.86]EZF72764.1 hypothetical protein H105_05047 [Trichophyton soudanense CBS 452.61]EZF83640.1 hypothetical protein H110_05027 [Trichophy